MAKSNDAPVAQTQKAEATPKAYTNKQVLAARLETARNLGYLTPKMQRGFDRMAANTYVNKGAK